MTFTNNLFERIARVGRLIADADYILIGAGAGLSAAADWITPERNLKGNFNLG